MDGGNANVLRLDEDDYIHHIDDAFTAQQMVRFTDDGLNAETRL